MQENIPLFPLKTVLFPKGRLPLQIFEQRYLEMVKLAMKAGSGFGIVPLKTGSEVGLTTDIYDRGVFVDIVDWNQLSNGLLGITVIGVRPFAIRSTRLQQDNLMVGDVEYPPEETATAMPEDHGHLISLLENLLNHSSVQKMDMICDFDDASHVSWLLSYLLPFSVATKVELLGVHQPLARLERIVTYLDEMTQQLNQ